jgi:endonuclease/exonuclease/phosphatase family metal-dependent hydrolase
VPPASLRVVTLNCWNIASPFEERMALIREGVERLQPDVIGLQEVIVRRDGFHQGEILLAGLGYEILYGAATRWTEAESLLPHDADGDAFGNLIASRYPIVASRLRELPGVETGERRTALAAHIRTPWGIVPFVTTHLNWKLNHGWVREHQVVALAELIEEWRAELELPAIAVGDFNAEPEANEIRFFCGLASLAGRSTCLYDAWRVAGDGGPGYTWDNRNRFARYSNEPNRRIDYVFVSPADAHGRGLIERAALVFNEPRGDVYASDHFGVLAEVKL